MFDVRSRCHHSMIFLAKGMRAAWLLTVFAAFAAAPAALAQADATKPAPAKAKPAAARLRYHPDRFAGRSGRYYKLLWGIDSMSVKLVESDQLVRFAWHVLDPDKAKALNDKKLQPTLMDPRAGVSLVVPAMEKIGQLRQGASPEAGKSYWMAFSNKGRPVEKGDRVSIVIGEFRADGLVVD